MQKKNDCVSMRQSFFSDYFLVLKDMKSKASVSISNYRHGNRHPVFRNNPEFLAGGIQI